MGNSSNQYLHEATPGRNSPVVVALVRNIHPPALVKHILLDVLSIGVHSAELIDIQEITIFPHTAQLYQRTIHFYLLLRVRLRVAVGKDILNMPHRNALIYLETAVVESPIHLGLGQHAFAPFSDVVVEARSEKQARNNALPKEITSVNNPIQRLRIPPQYLLLDVLLRAVTAHIAPLIG